MKNLVQVSNNQVVVSSRQIAEHFEKQHKHVLDAIEKLKAENSALRSMFCEGSYKVEGNNKTYPEYLMNRDGFSLLVMGFTGKKALEWKIKYIEAFNAMESEIKQGKALPKGKDETIKAKRVNVMETNARVRESNQYLKIAAQIDIPEYRYILQAKSAEALNGGVPVLPMQEVEKKTYSAKEIGVMFGVSANKIGKMANQHNLKKPEYGKLFYSKSEHSVKEVETWRYYDSVIPVFANIFGVKGVAV